MLNRIGRGRTRHVLALAALIVVFLIANVILTSTLDVRP
jgi:hypothetical protein